MIVYLDPGYFASESWFYRKKYPQMEKMYTQENTVFFSDSKQSNIEISIHVKVVDGIFILEEKKICYLGV